MIIFAKGDLMALIQKEGDFDRRGPLWDSPHNLQKMAEMQDAVLARCKDTFTRLYGGLVPPMYAIEGGPGSPGQPVKFYALVLVLLIVDPFDEEEVNILIDQHFHIGMSKFELGQFLIKLGCNVNLTKFGRALLQKWERGLQCSELATGRQGMTLQTQQISSWQSGYGSKMGDIVPLQSPGAFEEMLPTPTIIQARKPMFKKPFIPVCTFQVTPPPRDASPVGSAASLMQMGVTTTIYVEKKKSACAESPSPETLDRNRREHQSRDLSKKVRSSAQRSSDKE